MNYELKGALRPMAAASLLAAIVACGGGGSSSTNPNPVPTATPVPTPPQVSRAGLVLLMHMDEPAWNGAENQVLDASGSGHHGTATGGATTTASGKFGRGGSFNGGMSCVDLGDVPSLRPGSQLTVAAWVMPTGLGRQTPLGIVAKRVDFGFRSAYAFFVDVDDRLTVDVDGENDRFKAGPALTNGRLIHVAMVYDGSLPSASRVTVYIDGAAAGTGGESSDSIPDLDSPLNVGCLPLTLPAQGFVGTMDEVAIWHRALSAAEISSLARATAAIG